MDQIISLQDFILLFYLFLEEKCRGAGIIDQTTCKGLSISPSALQMQENKRAAAAYRWSGNGNQIGHLLPIKISPILAGRELRGYFQICKRIFPLRNSTHLAISAYLGAISLLAFTQPIFFSFLVDDIYCFYTKDISC